MKSRERKIVVKDGMEQTSIIQGADISYMLISVRMTIDKERSDVFNLHGYNVYWADKQWEDIIKCAGDQEIEMVAFITSDQDIFLMDDSIFNNPPHSTAAKILSFLYKRFKALEEIPGSGMTIMSTALANNSEALEAVVFELAHSNRLEYDFIDWLEEHNHFCELI